MFFPVVIPYVPLSRIITWIKPVKLILTNFKLIVVNIILILTHGSTLLC